MITNTPDSKLYENIARRSVDEVAIRLIVRFHTHDATRLTFDRKVPQQNSLILIADEVPVRLLKFLSIEWWYLVVPRHGADGIKIYSVARTLPAQPSQMKFSSTSTKGVVEMQ